MTYVRHITCHGCGSEHTIEDAAVIEMQCECGERISLPKRSFSEWLATSWSLSFATMLVRATRSFFRENFAARCRHGHILSDPAPCPHCQVEKRAIEAAKERMVAEYAAYLPEIQRLLYEYEVKATTCRGRSELARVRLLAHEGHNATEIRRLMSRPEVPSRVATQAPPFPPRSAQPPPPTTREILLPGEKPNARSTDAGCDACWRRMRWWDFEIAVCLLFERNGYSIRKEDWGPDGGLDGEITNHAGGAAIQCKRWGSKEYVELREVRDFVGALFGRGLKRGFFVTTGAYSRPAKDYAASLKDFELNLLTIHDLKRMGAGLLLTDGLISEAKQRWGVSERPPTEMVQQGTLRPKPWRRYRRRRY